MKEAVERAREILEYTRQTPGMFVSTKEALLARCSAILEMLGLEAGQPFYLRHLRRKGSTVLGFLDEPDNAWSEAVILDALSQLPKTDSA